MFLIVYLEKEITKTAQVEFRDNQFLHLTGVRTDIKADFPVSLYKEDVRKLSQPTNKVLAIFVREYNQQTYTECTYLSKGQEINKLSISEDTKTLIQMEKEDGKEKGNDRK